MNFLLSLFLKFASAPLVDKVLRYMERKAANGTERERIQANITIETIRAAVLETRIMADLQKSKFQYLAYWIFAGLFVLPLGFWWTAVNRNGFCRAPMPVKTKPNAQPRQH